MCGIVKPYLPGCLKIESGMCRCVVAARDSVQQPAASTSAMMDGAGEQGDYERWRTTATR